jgi:hypothetical protein
METNSTTIKLPTKVADFARSLEKNNIPYTLESTTTDWSEHITFWTFHSLEGRWFESQVHTLFIATDKHTTSYGTRKNSSVRYISTIIGSNTYKPKNTSEAVISWTVYAPKETN